LRAARHLVTHWGRDVLGLHTYGVVEIMPKQERIRAAAMIGLPVILYYSLYNLQAGLQVLAWLQFGVAFLLLAPALVLAVKNMLLPLSETLLMVSSVVIFGYMQVSGGLDATGVYWVYIFPFIAFFIAGQKNGWLWSIGFFVLSIAAHTLGKIVDIGFAYSAVQVTQQYAAFLFYTVAASMFNRLRSDFEHRLHEALTERSAAAEAYQSQLRHRTLHDSQTDLPNRMQFFALLTQKVAQCGDTAKIAVAYIKLERVLEISNIIGSDESRKLIKSIAQALLNRMKPDTLLARTGFDEFALAFSLSKSEDEMHDLHDFLDSRPFIHHANGQPLHIEYTLGLCSYPDFASGADQLLRRAEQAMMRARQKHLPLLRYESGQEEAFIRHHLLYGKLMRALESNQLSLVYQPQVDISSGKLLGVEALARWRDPQEGWIAPTEFIHVAEQSGLIHPLTHWIIRQGVAQCSEWHRTGLDVSVSLNLSARCFDDMELVDHLSETLRQAQAKPEWITLELTESTFMDNPEKALRLVKQFHEMGFHISIDDFGTGYSSLSYLKDLNADELKIDRGFVMNLPDSQNDVTIVQSIIHLAHNLGLKVVAEGIETSAASLKLRELGCDIAQGYYYSRPMPPEVLGLWAARLGTAPLDDPSPS
ncbi:MAG TPA: phosphodiesterase, partial [Gallionella sp.]|nr:phosphodiesterase [Gallionella sp.]